MIAVDIGPEELIKNTGLFIQLAKKRLKLFLVSTIINREIPATPYDQ
jgi:hypothetical protein